ncbi:MAG: glycosyltransferase family 2 protein [Rhizobiales bacterium]|nr:glycosyltransferase family 2 protein [Hyphomicrobiales bacterium]
MNILVPRSKYKALLERTRKFRLFFFRKILRSKRHLPSSGTSIFLEHIYSLAGQEESQIPLNRSFSAPALSFIVPVYNTPPDYLEALVRSLRVQVPGAWELVLSDDGSTNRATITWLDKHRLAPGLTVLRNVDNRGIAAATNAGIAAAQAPWIGFIDHDDALAPHAVDRILRALAARPDCEFLYTDEIIADGELNPVDVFLKPAFDPVLLSGVNYINHLSLYRRERLLDIGGLRLGFDGSQDYDLLLRYTKDLKPHQCLHLPYPAYLWRRDGGSYSAKFMEQATDNARRALAEAYAPAGQSIEVTEAIDGNLHRIRFDLTDRKQPLVSIIIPSRDQYEMIKTLFDELRDKLHYRNFEIIVIDNGSTDPKVLELYEQMRHSGLKFRAEVQPEAFNFSRAVNKGMRLAQGDLFLLLNNDIEPLDPYWLDEMVSCFAYDGVGIVGAKLLYPDRTLQHAGVIVGFGGLAGHWYIQEPANFPGPMGRLWVRQSMSCVTGACMLVSRKLIEQVGPLNEELFAVAYNDVDLCIRAVAAGHRIIWTPFAQLIHHESLSRGSDEKPENVARFEREKNNLRTAHATDRYRDRAINPWYSTDRSNAVPVLLPELPQPR